jgi:hypothetical protein
MKTVPSPVFSYPMILGWLDGGLLTASQYDVNSKGRFAIKTYVIDPVAGTTTLLPTRRARGASQIVSRAGRVGPERFAVGVRQYWEVRPEVFSGSPRIAWVESLGKFIAHYDYSLVPPVWEDIVIGRTSRGNLVGWRMPFEPVQVSDPLQFHEFKYQQMLPVIARSRCAWWIENEFSGDTPSHAVCRYYDGKVERMFLSDCPSPCLAVSPDGLYLAVLDARHASHKSADDGWCELWVYWLPSFPAPKLHMRIVLPSDGLPSAYARTAGQTLAFSPDGCTIVVQRLGGFQFVDLG